MQIILHEIKKLVAIGLLGAICTYTNAASKLPVSIEISGGRVIKVRSHRLYIEARGKVFSQYIKTPISIEHAIFQSSGVIFPESRSLTIQGREYILIIINQSSSYNPIGYCGSGDESELYVMQITKATAKVMFSKLVQSCLKNIDLSSDGSVSPYSSVSWNETPIGIRVAWMSDETGKEVTKIYQYDHGHFINESDSIK